MLFTVMKWRGEIICSVCQWLPQQRGLSRTLPPPLQAFAAIFQYTEKYIIGIITGSEITGMKCLEVKFEIFMKSVLVNNYTSDFLKLFLWSACSDLLNTLLSLVEVLNHSRQF